MTIVGVYVDHLFTSTIAGCKNEIILVFVSWKKKSCLLDHLNSTKVDHYIYLVPYMFNSYLDPTLCNINFMTDFYCWCIYPFLKKAYLADSLASNKANIPIYSIEY